MAMPELLVKVASASPTSPHTSAATVRFNQPTSRLREVVVGAGVEAVDARQLDVEDHDIGCGVGHLSESVFARLRLHDVVLLQLQHHRQRFTYALIVLDHQYPGALLHNCSFSAVVDRELTPS